MYFPERDKRATGPGGSRYFIPSGTMKPTRIENPGQLGKLIRSRRRELGLTQTEVADVANANLRFVSELERGKPTARLENVMRVLETLGIELEARTR
jgi:HTH-type transcriptional regulator / antitoxin HipB